MGANDFEPCLSLHRPGRTGPFGQQSRSGNGHSANMHELPSRMQWKLRRTTRESQRLWNYFILTNIKKDSDCHLSKTLRCKNYRWNSPDVGNRCLAACPIGTWVDERQVGAFTEKVCQPCDSACVSCTNTTTRAFTFTYDNDNDPDTAEITNTAVELQVCQQCQEGK